jgi:hypothetical protein
VSRETISKISDRIVDDLAARKSGRSIRCTRCW